MSESTAKGEEKAPRGAFSFSSVYLSGQGQSFVRNFGSIVEVT